MRDLRGAGGCSLIKSERKMEKQQSHQSGYLREMDDIGQQNELEFTSSMSGFSCQFSVAEEESWIQSFCNRKGNEYFCMVDTNYIIDDFNLKGLEKTVEYYKESIYHILDYEQSGKLALRPDEVMDLSDNVKLLNREAEILYGMIHARFIVTPKGLDLMRQKFIKGDFGYCPRILCKKQLVLPLGRHDKMGKSKVKLCCPVCQELYDPPSSKHSNIDGAFFGRSFANIFKLQFSELCNGKFQKYQPRIWGFKLSKNCKNFPPKLVYNIKNKEFERESAREEVKMQESPGQESSSQKRKEFTDEEYQQIKGKPQRTQIVQQGGKLV